MHSPDYLNIFLDNFNLRRLLSFGKTISRLLAIGVISAALLACSDEPNHAEDMDITAQKNIELSQERSDNAKEKSFRQYEAGETLFTAECAACHLPTIFPEQVQDNWQGQTLLELFDYTKNSMPPERTGTLSDQEYLDILTFLLSSKTRDSASVLRSEEDNWQTQIIPAREQNSNKEDMNVAALDWQYYRGNSEAQAYAALSDLTVESFRQLGTEWSIDLSNFGPVPEQKNPATPIVVDGRMFLTAGLSRNVLALDAVTGELLWMFRPQERARLEQAPRKGAGRGVGYWQDEDGKGRIILITPGFQLFALDALTGKPIAEFGTGGRVDMMEGLRFPPDGSRDIGNSSPPMIVGDVIVVGPAHATSMRPDRLHNVKGDVRGYDIRSGNLLWTFHTIPEPGEAGYETWENDSALTTGNAGVWAPMSADQELGIVYLPVEASTHDIYGGHRPGSNLYANSLVALNAQTGKRIWHHQLVHHDLWDWDLPCAPILVDVPDGRKIVVQLTKQGFAFVFDRITGEPIWPIIERSVPASDVPGETAWPSQPFPIKPPPFERQGVTEDDLIDFTPALRAEAKALIADLRLGSFFTPPSLLEDPDGTAGTLSLPGAFGGANWEGGAADPTTGVIFIPSITKPTVFNLKNSDHPRVPYISGKRYRLTVGNGIPIIKPPYGRITAIDLKSGDIVWQMANADGPEDVLNNPKLAGLELPPLGVANRSGLLVTEHFLITGEGYEGAPILRALDKSTGKEIARIDIPGTQTGLPMAYSVNGKDYIAMTVSGLGLPAKLIVLSVP